MAAKKLNYFMESQNELVRLKLKDDSNKTRNQLLNVGLASYLKDDKVILDAGTGVGVVAEEILKLRDEMDSKSQVVLLDGSAERLSQAKENLKGYNKGSQNFIETNLENINLDSNSVDFIFCRFVFEYLKDPKIVHGELVRILKPGGKLVIADLDLNCLNHFPMSDFLESSLYEIKEELFSRKLINFNIGRMLYKLHYDSPLKEINCHVDTHHLFFGKLKPSDRFNWKKKLEQICEFHRRGLIELSFDPERFSYEFMEFLEREDRFTYTPIIIVEGVK